MLRLPLDESTAEPSPSALFRDARPYEHLVIDDCCEPEVLASAMPAITAHVRSDLATSGDLMFARNKFVDSEFHKIHSVLAELRNALLESSFADWLSKLVDEPVFVDPQFYGGGLHAGGERSFLDMHTDFNYHPKNPHWRRKLNLLLYLNQDWQPGYGGGLLMQHVEHQEDPPHSLDPLFNRLVIMRTDSHTLHGYDPICFPEGKYRLSIAAYAYAFEERREEDAASTIWYPTRGGAVKRFAGKLIPRVVSALRGFKRDSK